MSVPPSSDSMEATSDSVAPTFDSGVASLNSVAIINNIIIQSKYMKTLSTTGYSRKVEEYASDESA